MLRNTTLAVLTVLALAASSQAAVILSQDAGTPTQGLAGFKTVTVTATSDVPGETITGFDFIGDPAVTDPQTARGFFGAMNQVQLFGGALSTVFTDNNAVMDAQPGLNHSQDSQFLHATNGLTPVNSPSGFNSEGPTHLRALFGRDTGFGQSTPLVQLVIPDAATGTINYRGVIGVSRGGSIVDLPEITGAITTDVAGNLPPVAAATDLGDVANAIINHLFTATDDGGTSGLSWGNLQVTAGSPAFAPILGANGQFTWATQNSARPAIYTFEATVTDAGGLTDVGTLTLNLIVPEPASMTLFGLAMIGLVGFGFRKRS